ncbi:hypothetical protein EAS64_42620 [Trebonia kvetii]|uniref:YCII-related domain-containing protein n=1 Tax=Trebonia kvetii TaxID=2480626 RepID=A0A6P2BKL4_9ACTN|nr:hypothetical protein [Trebonia kvetii]TVY98954.1 hypothetical protein EAS64_42620 [Trebonia kvetii]
MFAQLVIFDGPRSPEFSAAADRAGRGRIMPMLASDPVFGPAHPGSYILQAADGGRAVLILADTEAAITHASKLVTGSELLPDEDPALLTDPDHVVTYEVVYAMSPGFPELGNN